MGQLTERGKTTHSKHQSVSGKLCTSGDSLTEVPQKKFLCHWLSNTKTVEIWECQKQKAGFFSIVIGLHFLIGDSSGSQRFHLVTFDHALYQCVYIESIATYFWETFEVSVLYSNSPHHRNQCLLYQGVVHSNKALKISTLPKMSCYFLHWVWCRNNLEWI